MKEYKGLVEGIASGECYTLSNLFWRVKNSAAKNGINIIFAGKIECLSSTIGTKVVTTIIKDKDGNVISEKTKEYEHEYKEIISLDEEFMDNNYVTANKTLKLHLQHIADYDNPDMNYISIERCLRIYIEYDLGAIPGQLTMSFI